MLIDGVIDARLEALSVRSTRDGERRVTIKCAWRGDELDTRGIFGNDLARLAFEPMAAEGDDWECDYSSLRPSSPPVVHTIKMLGSDYTGTPSVTGVTPVKGNPRINIAMQIDLAAEADVLGELAMLVGSVLSMRLAPRQPKLPGFAEGV